MYVYSIWVPTPYIVVCVLGSNTIYGLQYPHSHIPQEVGVIPHSPHKYSQVYIYMSHYKNIPHIPHISSFNYIFPGNPTWALCQVNTPWQWSGACSCWSRINQVPYGWTHQQVTWGMHPKDFGLNIKRAKKWNVYQRFFPKTQIPWLLRDNAVSTRDVSRSRHYAVWGS